MTMFHVYSRLNIMVHYTRSVPQQIGMLLGAQLKLIQMEIMSMENGVNVVQDVGKVHKHIEITLYQNENSLHYTHKICGVVSNTFDQFLSNSRDATEREIITCVSKTHPFRIRFRT